MKNKVISALAAVILAFGLWLYVITVISPDQTRPYYKVPVILDNESSLTEKQLMLISDPNPLVTVELAGTRSDLNKINPSNLTALADLSGIDKAGEYLVGYTVLPPNDLVNGAISVQDRNPKQVSVIVAEKITNNVPVQIAYTGSVPEGYIKGTPQFDHTEIKVSGPREVIEKIDHATIKVDLNDRKESLTQSYRYELQDATGEPLDVQMVTTNVEEVRLQLRISAIKKVNLRVDIVDGGGATKDTSSVIVDPGQISISGSESVLKDLNELVIGTINLADFPDASSKNFEIAMPEGITNESGVTSASVAVSFPKLGKKTFDINSIETLNVPDKMEADVLTKMLTVTIRGPIEQINALQVSDISVRVDASQVSGADTVEPFIVISDKYPDLGPVGKYSVSVSVAPAAKTTTEGN